MVRGGSCVGGRLKGGQKAHTKKINKRTKQTKCRSLNFVYNKHKMSFRATQNHFIGEQNN